MKHSKVFTWLGICFLMVLSSCKYGWVISEYKDERVWEWTRIKKKKLINKCVNPYVLERNKPTKYIEEENRLVFEFDSIRVYTSTEDSLLQAFISHGLIQGQYFLKKDKSTRRRNRDYMTKQVYDGVEGYHVEINRMIELRNRNVPHKYREIEKKIRYFRLKCRVQADTYFANPSNYTLTLFNNDLESYYDMSSYLEKAQVFSFVFKGGQI